MDEVITKRKRFALSYMPSLLKRSYTNLVHNDPLRMAGATAFFTSFALPFILIILTQVLSLFIDPLKLRKELYEDLSGVLGRQSMHQVIETLIAFRQLANNTWITIFGSLFLLLVATTLLMVIKGSINQLWRIKPEAGRSIAEKLGSRLQSVLIILATAVLIIVSIVAETVRANLGTTIGKLSPTIAFYFNSVFTQALSLVFVTLWFSIIFRLLPDGRPPWKVALTGAFVTAVLFTIGKFVLRLLLTSSNLGSLYGTSASVVLILLFVFYSSLILYYGASFTVLWADHVHKTIRPLSYATHYKVTDVKEPLPKTGS